MYVKIYPEHVFKCLRPHAIASNSTFDWQLVPQSRFQYCRCAQLDFSVPSTTQRHPRTGQPHSVNPGQVNHTASLRTGQVNHTASSQAKSTTQRRLRTTSRRKIHEKKKICSACWKNSVSGHCCLLTWLAVTR